MNSRGFQNWIKQYEFSGEAAKAWIEKEQEIERLKIIEMAYKALKRAL